MLSPLPWLAFGLATTVAAQDPGSIVEAGDTLVSAMMVRVYTSCRGSGSQLWVKMFLGNEEKVYILDKSEGNAATINGHPAWGAVWLVPFVPTPLCISLKGQFQGHQLTDSHINGCTDKCLLCVGRASSKRLVCCIWWKWCHRAWWQHRIRQKFGGLRVY